MRDIPPYRGLGAETIPAMAAVPGLQADRAKRNQLGIAGKSSPIEDRRARRGCRNCLYLHASTPANARSARR
jgi:hypothetical protein